LGVVIYTGQTQCFQAIDRPLILDKPTTGTHANEITALRHGVHSLPPKRVYLGFSIMDDSRAIRFEGQAGIARYPRVVGLARSGFSGF
jgi:hypothetical protein